MMKKDNRPQKNSRITIALFALAAILLVFSGIGSTKAALTYFSENYTMQAEMFDIGITLMENGNDISHRDYTGKDNKWDENTGKLLEHMLDEDKTLKVGKNYKEELTVRNSGNIDSYVRVRIYKYWVDEKGKKTTSQEDEEAAFLTPDFIDLHLTDSAWIVKKDKTTAERQELYYPHILKVGETAPLFADKIKIDEKVASKVKETVDENGIVTVTYAYNGYKFMLEAEADAVQTHNAAEAIKSAWGVDVNVSKNGSLSLK